MLITGALLIFGSINIIALDWTEFSRKQEANIGEPFFFGAVKVAAKQTSKRGALA